MSLRCDVWPLWLLGAMLVWFAPVLALAVEPPPNLIVVLADDLGRGEVGCYGQTKIRTPSMDRMAVEGMRFTRAYAGNAVCAPSRCVLLTGKHAGRAAIRANWEVQPEGQHPLPAVEVTLAELLKTRGYATGFVGKWGLGPVGSQGDPLAQGFDFFYGYNCQRHAHNHYVDFLYRNTQREPIPANRDGAEKVHSHDLMTKEALEWVRAHREGPFFLELAYAIPHLPLQVPEDSLAEYQGAFAELPYDGSKGYRAHPTPRAAYAAMVSRLDRDLGRLLDLIQELGIEHRTIVLFTSDNGPTFDLGGADTAFFEGARGLRGHKGLLYEGGIATPLIAWAPGRIKPGTTSDLLCAFDDLLPTLCDFAGVPAAVWPADLTGVSIRPTLEGRCDAQTRRSECYWELAQGVRQQAIQTSDRLKLVVTHGGLNQPFNPPHVELFDLATDPAETRNLAAERPDNVARLQRRIEAIRVPPEVVPMP